MLLARRVDVRDSRFMLAALASQVDYRQVQVLKARFL